MLDHSFPISEDGGNLGKPGIHQNFFRFFTLTDDISTERIQVYGITPTLKNFFLIISGWQIIFRAKNRLEIWYCSFFVYAILNFPRFFSAEVARQKWGKFKIV